MVLTSALAQLMTCTVPHLQSFEQGKVSSRPVLAAGRPNRSRQVFETWNAGLKSQHRSCDTLSAPSTEPDQGLASWFGTGESALESVDSGWTDSYALRASTRPGQQKASAAKQFNIQQRWTRESCLSGFRNNGGMVPFGCARTANSIPHRLRRPAE